MIETFMMLAERGGVCAPPIPQRLSPSPIDDYWYSSIGSYNPTATGVRVDEQSAFRISAFFACVRVIAESLAACECNVYRKLPNGGKEVAETHALQLLLHDSPSEELTAFEFWETVLVHLLTWGNAYVLTNEVDTRGNVIELRILQPGSMTVGRDKQTGLRYYRYVVNGETTIYLDADLMHIPALGYDGLKGLSPVSLFRETLGLTSATEQFAAKFFGNNAMTGGYIKHPLSLGDKGKKSLTEGWNQIKQGLQGAHKMGILDEGMSIETLSTPMKDIALIDMRQFSVEEIARIFRVPPHLIQHLLRATNNNIEHQGIDFVTHTLRPWAERIEARIQKCLFGPRESAKFFAEFDLTSLLRGDSVARSTYFSNMRNSGALEANEWRAAEGLNPHPEGGGLWIQGAMIPVAAALKNAENPPAPAPPAAPAPAPAKKEAA